MLNKTFNDYTDYANNKYFTAEEVAKSAIKQLFTGIQQGKGEYKGQIRSRKKLVEITMEGFIYEFSNKGRKVQMLSRAYDVIVTSTDEDCINYKSSLYFSTWE